MWRQERSDQPVKTAARWFVGTHPRPKASAATLLTFVSNAQAQSLPRAFFPRMGMEVLRAALTGNRASGTSLSLGYAGRRPKLNLRPGLSN
jgi:hypothetical protein